MTPREELSAGANHQLQQIAPGNVSYKDDLETASLSPAKKKARCRFRDLVRIFSARKKWVERAPQLIGRAALICLRSSPTQLLASSASTSTRCFVPAQERRRAAVGITSDVFGPVQAAFDCLLRRIDDAGGFCAEPVWSLSPRRRPPVRESGSSPPKSSEEAASR